MYPAVSSDASIWCKKLRSAVSPHAPATEGALSAEEMVVSGGGRRVGRRADAVRAGVGEPGERDAAWRPRERDGRARHRGRDDGTGCGQPVLQEARQGA